MVRVGVVVIKNPMLDCTYDRCSIGATWPVSRRRRRRTDCYRLAYNNIIFNLISGPLPQCAVVFAFCTIRICHVKRPNPSVKQLHTPSYMHAFHTSIRIYLQMLVLTFEWGYRGCVPSANIRTTTLSVSCACVCVMRVRISWFMGISIYARVLPPFRRELREFVIFQFLCVSWGTAKSRQTVCEELARDAVVCPSLSPTSLDVCIAYDGIEARSSNSFGATLDVRGEWFSFKHFFSCFVFGVGKKHSFSCFTILTWRLKKRRKINLKIHGQFHCVFYRM